jgi:hypothetical protein
MPRQVALVAKVSARELFENLSKLNRVMPKRRNAKAKAFFWVASPEISAKEISKKTGIKFDRQIVKSTPNPSGNTKLHHIHIGIIQSKPSPSEGMEEHLRNLLSRLTTLRKKIKNLPEGCSVGISLNYDMAGDFVGGWELSPEVLKKLNELGLACMVSLSSTTKTSKRRK